jgi:hypothetical protein
LEAEFKPDNTLEIEENGQLMQTLTWQVKNLNDDNHRIKVNPLVLLLTGRTLFSEERVLLNDSYLAGCDSYFQKVS